MRNEAALTAAGSAPRKRKRQSAFAIVVRRLAKNPGAMTGFVILVVLTVVAILAPYIIPYNYAQVNIKEKLQAPTLKHLFGTDELGRDILSRVMYGGRYSLRIGLLAVAMSCGIGMIFGAVAGYFGGKVDMIIMRFLDIFSSIPNMLMAICIAAVLGPGLNNCIIALGVSGVPSFARILRGSILNVRSMEYVIAATTINCSPFRVITRHVVPNALSPIIVMATMGIAYSLIMAAGLSYIGLGVQPPMPEWGAMVAGARNYIRHYPHMIMIPGVVIMITVLSMNLIGDALRDALDPKLKK